MIIEELDLSLFESRFKDYNRVGEGKNFSFRGLRALFDYLEESFSDEEPYKLDVISLCCEYNEYKDMDEYLQSYSLDREENESDEDFKARVEQEIMDNTTLLKFSDDLDDGFIIAGY